MRNDRSILSLFRVIPIQQQKAWEVGTFATLRAEQKEGNIQDSQNSETRMPTK